MLQELTTELNKLQDKMLKQKLGFLAIFVIFFSFITCSECQTTISYNTYYTSCNDLTLDEELPNLSFATDSKAPKSVPVAPICNVVLSDSGSVLDINFYYYPNANNLSCPAGRSVATSTANFTSAVINYNGVNSLGIAEGTIIAGAYLGATISVTNTYSRNAIACSSAIGQEMMSGITVLTITPPGLLGLFGTVVCHGVTILSFCPGIHAGNLSLG